MTTYPLADTFTVSRPRATTGMNVWSDGDDHSALLSEPVPLNAFDWTALASLPSVPVASPLASMTDVEIDRHAEEPSEQVCAHFQEASDLYWALHGPLRPLLLTPRFEVADDGLLVVDGRAWLQAQIKATASDAENLLDALADSPDCLVLDEWSEWVRFADRGIEVVVVQVALPYTEQARTWLDGLACSLITGPPRGEPSTYMVAPTENQTRIMAVVPVLHGSVLRALLTARDESAVHTVNIALNRVLETMDIKDADCATHLADTLLSPSCARAVATEVATIMGFI